MIGGTGGPSFINDRGEIAATGVLPNGDHRAVLPAARADDFLACFEASSLQPDCAKGLFAAQPSLHLLFGGHLLISAKLLIQLPVDVFFSEQ